MKRPDRSRPIGATLLVLALCATLGISALTFSSCSKQKKREGAATDDTLGVVLLAEGGFELRRGGEYWLGAQEATSLCPGDTVSTPYGEIVTGLLGGITLRVAGGSWLDISTGRPALSLKQGRTLVQAPDAPGGLKVRTPAGDITISWGAIEVSVEPGGRSTFTSYEGKAVMSAGGAEARLDGGNTCSIEPGARPDPQKISSGSMPQIAGYGRLVDLQATPFFEYEQAREDVEASAKAKLAVDAVDVWSHVNLGRALLDKGDREGARAGFEAALAIDTQHVQALLGLGKVKLAERKWDEADGLYSRAKHADRTSIEAAYGSAHAALGRGDLDEAERRYKAALRVDGQDAQSMVGLGDVMLLKGDVDTALERFKGALDVNPHLAIAIRQSGIANALKREQALSESDLNRAVTEKANYYEAWDSLGIRYLKVEETMRAGTCFRKLEDADDLRWRAEGLRQTSYIEAMEGNLRAAASRWGKSLDLVGGRPGVLANEGLVRLSLGEYQAAADAFAADVRLEPDSAYARAGLARAFWAMGQRDAAAAEATKAALLDPSDWRSRVMEALSGQGGEGAISAAVKLAPREGLSASDRGLLGEAFMAREDFTAAVEQFKEAAKLQPASSEWLREQADALASAGKSDQALAMYRKVLKKNAADLPSRMALAGLLEAKGDRSGAQEQLKRALEQDPNAWQASVKLGILLLADGDVDGAVSEFEKARSAQPQPADIANILLLEGNAFDRRQMFPESIAAYQQALTLDPSRGDAWFYLAGDLERTGQPVPARAAYQKALELCGNRPEWKKFYNESEQKLSQPK